MSGNVFRAPAGAIAAALVAGVLLAGCMSQEMALRVLGKKYHTENFYLSPDPADTALKKVILVPFYNETNIGEAATEITQTFRVELEKLHRFEIVTAGQFEKDLIAQNVFATGKFSQTDLYMVCRSLNAQGVIFGTVKQYRPYRPLLLGAKAFLVRAETGKVAWAVDDVFDATRKEVCNGAILYFYKKIEPPDDEQSRVALSSMKYFAAYVCHELVRSLGRGGQG